MSKRRKLFVKINVMKIIIAHGNTLVDARSKRLGWDDIVTFIIIPALFSFGAIRAGLTLGNNAITIIITALSIFVGLLFNMVVLVFDILKRDASNETKNSILKQILANISFTILLSIFIIGLSLISLVKHHMIIKAATDYVIFFLLAFFFLTLVMVLKRMYTLFDNEMKELEKKVTSTATESTEC